MIQVGFEDIKVVILGFMAKKSCAGGGIENLIRRGGFEAPAAHLKCLTVHLKRLAALRGGELL